jgi:hypothetical protein
MFLLISDMILVIEVYIDMVLNLSIPNNKDVKF